jgi:hypothetical protein
MNTQHLFQSILQRVFRLPTLHLDATDRRPQVWAAVLGGTGLGLIWGIAARIWMRLIATKPEFSISGTLIILTITTLFGAWTGFAFAARRRGWRRWRHYAPRSLMVAFFVPLGFGGGLILMLTVLLATLAVTQPALLCMWIMVILIIPLGLDSASPGVVIGSVLTLAVALTAWKWRTRHWHGNSGAQQVDRWLDRIVRSLLLLLSIGAVGVVAWDVLTDKPGWPGPLYMLFYLILLYPLFLALRVGLQQRQADYPTG